MNASCTKLEKCPVFINNLSFDMGQTYRNLYCLAVGSNFMTCKRYIASEKFGKGLHGNIMPNSLLHIKEIGLRMQ
jgi:hypothetical protein